MTDLPHEELISAYLDGELTAQEQEQVEELLATSAEARALLEELRALGGTLQSMPRKTVGSDLSEAVLRRAEREMLAGRPRLESAAGEGEVELKRSIPGLSWTSWRWPAAVAVAAALLLMLNLQANRQRDPQPAALRELAKAPSGGEAAMSSRDEAPRSREVPTGVAVPSEDEAGKESSDAVREGAPAPSGASADRNFALPASPPSAIVAEKATEPRVTASESARDQASDSGVGDTVHRGAGRLSRARSDALRSAQLDSDRVSADDLLVVQVDIAPQAAAAGAFDELLTQQNIVLDEAPGEAGSSSQLARKAPAKLAEKEQLGLAKGGAAPAQQQRDASETELVYVEASAAQVEATLAELNAQTHNYLSVAVEPAPRSQEQAPLARYNRVVPIDTRKRALLELQNRFAQDKLGSEPARSELRAAPANADAPQSSDARRQSKQNFAGKAERLEAKKDAGPLPRGEAAAVRSQHQNGYALRFNLQSPAAESEPADRWAATEGERGRAAAGQRRPAEPAAPTQPLESQSAAPSADNGRPSKDLESQMLRVLFVFRLGEQPSLLDAPAAESGEARPSAAESAPAAKPGLEQDQPDLEP